MSYISEIKKNSKSKKFGTLLLSIIITYAVVFPFQLLTELSEFYSFLRIYSFMGTVVSFVLIPVYVVGVRSTALKVSRWTPISVVQPFKDGFDNYGRKLGGALWKELLLLLWSLIALIPLVMFIALEINRFIMFNSIKDIPFLFYNNLFYFILALLISLALFIPVYIKSLSYGFTEYILAEYPNVKARDALKISMRMTKGRKWTMFLFDLSFIGWFLIVPLTFGLILLYLVPYYEIAKATLYDSLKIYALNNGMVLQAELERI